MNIYLLIVLLAITTFASRAIPAILIGQIHFSRRARCFLELVPITSMTALVVPSIFQTDSQYISIGIVGGLVAGLCAWFKAPVIISVIAAVAAVFCCYQAGLVF